MSLRSTQIQYTEILNIENFLSIKEFKWNVKRFNIITGDMGSGKSLCIKLIYFFEELIISSILLAPGFSQKLFQNGNFLLRLSKKFKDYFYLKDGNWEGLKIEYIFMVNGSNFSIFVEWDNETNDLSWKCDYLAEHLNKWSGYFESPETTPDMARDVKNRINEEINHDFQDILPIATTFVPASRAALTIVGSNTAFKDSYLGDFAHDKDFLLSYDNISLRDELANILKVNNIKKNPDDESDIVLEHSDGRTVPSLYSSSGQQELVYLLLLMEKLPDIEFKYGRILSIFLEEPSAHLFPREQKELIEQIAYIFQKEKRMETRFFITTHSPYVLNVVNNMLKKGNLINKFNGYEEEIDNDINFPALFIDDVSAFFIGDDGKAIDMLDRDEEIIFADKIFDISRQINDDTDKLDDLNLKLINKKGSN